MRIHLLRMTLALATLLLASLACNLPGQNAAPPVTFVVATPAAATTAALPSASVAPSATVTPTHSASATAEFTTTPSSTATIAGPVVTRAALCYVGPATKGYDVTSSIKAGTSVELLGRSPIPGWWVIRDPRYHDPCWIQSGYIQIDPSMDTSGLPVYNIPGTNTPGPSPTP